MNEHEMRLRGMLTDTRGHTSGAEQESIRWALAYIDRVREQCEKVHEVSTLELGPYFVITGQPGKFITRAAAVDAIVMGEQS